MKATIERATLLRCMSHVQSVVERRNTIPILSNVLIDAAEDGTVKVMATDLDLQIVETVSASKVETPGAITVSAHLLNDIIRKLKEGSQVSLDAAENRLEIRSGRANFKLPTLPRDDFPVIVEGDLPTSFELPAKQLAEMIDRTRFAISTEETRYYLNGIFLHDTDDDEPVLKAAATAGHRLARFTLASPEGAAGMPDVIVPRKAVGEIRKLIEEADGNVLIDLSASKIRFTISGEGGVVLTSKLIDGTFPDWTRVLPQIPSEAPEICFTPRKMRAVLNRMQIGLSRNGQVIDICADSTGQTVVITAKTQDDEECSERLDGATAAYWSKMDNGIVSINSRYLKEICRTHIQSEEVTLTAADNRSPIQIVPNAYKALTVLMPVRGGNGLRNEALMALSPASNDPASDQKEVA